MTTAAPATTAVRFKSILFATDFSPSSEAAVPFLLSLARWHDAKIIVAHAVPIEPVAGITPSPPAAEIDLAWQEARAAMQRYQENHAFAELRHEFVLERGDLLPVISDLVQHDKVDLVVLGTHGRQGFRKLFAGSLAEQIFRAITGPILTVGPGAEGLPPNWNPKQILFATDFSSGSLQALPYALSLADQNHAELTLMHAVPLVPWEQQADVAPDYQLRLQKLIPEESEHVCKLRFEVRFDLAAPAILTLAKDSSVDLIVMGVHSAFMPRVDSHVPWTTAYEVISNAHCPVLTVRG